MIPRAAEERESLVTMIKRYWAQKGHAVKVWTELIAPSGGPGAIEIRSDMVNGYPRSVLKGRET